MILVENPRAARRRAEGRPPVSVLPADDIASAQEALRGWPEYATTPCIPADELAAKLGISELWLKDEGAREPLRSFKALGGAYALDVALQSSAGEITHVCCASAGNHGRSVAWRARERGLACTVYLAANVSTEKVARIAAYGADIIRVDGTYDDALEQCQRDADKHGRLLIQDTSFPGYVEPCARIMCGYSLLGTEALAQMAGEPPTHVFLQVGCGGLAVAVIEALIKGLGDDLPTIVLMQSKKAASLLESFRQGEIVEFSGELATSMTGIAVSHLSMVAWESMRECGDFAVTVSDQAARAAVDSLGSIGVITTTTGAAGYAALLSICGDDAARATVGLDAGSRVLCIVSERSE